jgi:hypothetical protein
MAAECKECRLEKSIQGDGLCGSCYGKRRRKREKELMEKGKAAPASAEAPAPAPGRMIITLDLTDLAQRSIRSALKEFVAGAVDAFTGKLLGLGMEINIEEDR